MEKTQKNSGQSRLQRLHRSTSGQVGIIMLLITVVMLTVGISAVSRTTSDVNISSTNEQANRALDIAESNVEKALNGNLNNTTGPIATTSPDGTVAVQTNVVSKTNLETNVEQGVTVGVDLTGNNGAPVNIQWAKESSCATQASLVITILSNKAADPVRRYYVSPPSCRTSDGFMSPSGGPLTPGFKFRHTVATTSQDYLIRIRPVYNGSDIRVDGSSLNTQSYTVTSTAQNSTSKETKAVEVTKTLPVAPSVLDYVLFSGTSITQ